MGMYSKKGLHPHSVSAILKVMLLPPQKLWAETGIASLRSTILNVWFSELRRQWVNSLGKAVASWFKGKRLIILEFHLALLVRWSGHFGDLWCLCIVPCTFPSFSRSLRPVPFWNAQSVSDYINPCSSNRAGALTQNSQLLVLCAVTDNIHEPFYLWED